MEQLEVLQKTVQFLTMQETAAIMDYIEQKDFFIHREELGMMMSGVNDSFNNPFFLGEILVCEAEVEYKKNRGYGMVMGSNKEHAIIMAVADSAYQLKDYPFLMDLELFLKPANTRMQESLCIEKKFVSSTKVDFGLMVEG